MTTATVFICPGCGKQRTLSRTRAWEIRTGRSAGYCSKNCEGRRPAPAGPGIRWSAARDCPRKAVYSATTVPERDLTDREQRILYRGRSLGRDYADWLEHAHGKENVLREVKVPWELGVGHIDIFLVPARTAIEVLSSKHASDAMVQSKLLQLVLYMENFPAADNGCLVVLDPGDFTEERFPLARGTDAYEALVEQMNERIGELRVWRDTGALPGRVCRKPSDAYGHFCRHAETCFAGWEPPEPDAVVTDPAAVALATDLAYAKEEERSAKAVATAKEDLRRGVERRLVSHEQVDGVEGDIAVGSYVVRRTHVRRRPSLDVRKAELAGVLNVEALAEFMRPGADYWTTTVERADTGSPIDFGEEAPWTEEDLIAAFEASS